MRPRPPHNPKPPHLIHTHPNIPLSPYPILILDIMDILRSTAAPRTLLTSFQPTSLDVRELVVALPEGTVGAAAAGCAEGGGVGGDAGAGDEA